MREFWLLLIMAILVLITTPEVDAATADPRGTVLRLFNQYDLVAIPEFHRAKEVHEFLQSLVRDRRLTKQHVTNIVVEFGNAKYQDVADRYVFGGQIPRAEVEKIWRNTTMFLVWDSPLYEEFFQTVREVNMRLPRSKKIRVILGDPPIGWEIVHTKSDYERYADRDLFYAEVVEREILNRGQKALLIAGGIHFINSREPKKQVPDRKRSAADLLHRRHPGKLFAFWHTREPIAGQRCGSPCVVVARGTRLGSESFAPFAPKGMLVQKVVDGEKQWVPLETSDWPSVVEMADGLIYFGANLTTIEPAAATYLDSSYVKELRRRVPILSEVYGMDFSKELDEALSRQGSH
ncbi:MAG TPA: hypothetical protein VJ715_09570 [Pyrinomonadaceae bacterium]|nr:hypothetical protein [Pyrinomonadaceae bacterium]